MQQVIDTAKYYNIAGLNVKMSSYGRTDQQAEAYKTDKAVHPDFEVKAKTYLLKDAYKNASEELCEYLMSGYDFYKKLLDYDGLMLHSSAVVVNDRAYLFSADPGTGKSTHTGLWLKLFGDRAYILNDDKPALRLEEGIWYAYGTPWSGKDDISVNRRVPIAGIALIERSETNEIYPFSGPEAIRQILAQTNRPKAAEYRIKLMELLDKLLTMVPIWKLKCNMDTSAAVLSYEVMSGEKFNENENT